MAVPQKGVWGIDIGQCALKAIRLELIDGRPTATAFDYVEHTKILSQPDADPDALIREALEKFLSRNTLKFDDVAIGIAGQSGLARFVKLPPVEEKKIAEIVKFEAKQQIPFPLDEVVWDFQKIAGGESVDGFALETEIGLFAMKRDVIARYLGYFAGSKVEVHMVQMSPLALVNFATYEILKKGGSIPVPEDAPDANDDTPKGKKRCAVVMDIGTDASNLIITDGGKIIWQRPIPLGGNNFTRALTKELKLTFAKAEHLKRNAAKSPEMANILKAIKPVLTDFVGEVQRSLGYFTNTHRDAHVAYLVGLGSAFKLPGLQKYLGDKLSLEVRKPSKFARLAGEGVLADPLFQENLLTFPIAYGLALQGLGEARLATNLLPPEIRFDRIIRGKKPYAVAAAAMLLVGTTGLALGFSADLKSVSDAKIKTAQDHIKAAIGQHDSQLTKFNDSKNKSLEEQARGKTVIAGQEERLNWPRLIEVQTAVMPRAGDKADGGNIPGDFKWQGSENVGVAALDWFKQRMARGVPIEQALADDASDHPKNLAMVNVEAIHTRWVTNPAEFLAAADDAVYGDGKTRGYGKFIAEKMLDAEKEPSPERGEGKFKPAWKPVLGPNEKPPEGVWVVEVRGYTDHHEGPAFLERALLRNLQKFDTFAAQGEVKVRNEKGEVTVRNDNKVGQFIVGVQDPVKGKVSHPFIYNIWMVEDAPQNTFKYISASYLDKLFADRGGRGGAGGFPGGPPVPPPPGPEGGAPAAAAPLGPDWKERLTATAAAAQPGGPAPFTPPPPVGAPGVGEKKDGAPTRRRYEFVVMFIWREPVPSGSGTVDPNAAAGGAPGQPGTLPGRGGE
ncbi:type IV pilus assembly protein PilM [Gemmata sp.]|uniref:type IV pilus assembly protein PilM n=1 Tax=Gemmata sp. TaxID=1914242 RepID=UPI003F6E6A2A